MKNRDGYGDAVWPHIGDTVGMHIGDVADGM
ncbi:hypothetical protein A2U01_0062124, partial [Trifolium medium]|nr:hypothetical protein [Trifolium medium]